MRENNLPVFLISWGKYSVLHHFVQYHLCDFLQMLLIKLRKFSYFPNFLRIFIMNGYQISSNAFSESMNISMCFFFFSVLIWLITLNDFLLLSQFCISEINPTWQCCIILLYIVEFYLAIFC